MRKVTDVLLERVATRLRAMGSPMRLRILHSLEDGELTVTELVAATRSSQANVSKHLMVLRAAGLVKGRRDGMTVKYAISDPMVLDICRSVCDSILCQASDEAKRLARGA